MSDIRALSLIKELMLAYASDQTQYLVGDNKWVGFRIQSSQPLRTK